MISIFLFNILEFVHIMVETNEVLVAEVNSSEALFQVVYHLYVQVYKVDLELELVMIL